VEAAAVIAASGVLAISKRVRGAAVEQVPLRPCVLLQVGVLIGGEVLVGGGVVARAGILVISVLLIYRYYTFLVGVLARLLVEANFVRFLP
jgi:hypothetical protein